VRVLITGAGGFAGRHLVALCAEAGDEVAGVGRSLPADAALADALVEFQVADLTEPAAALDAVSRASPEAVFHLAAEASVGRSWEAPGEVIETNVSATRNLLDAVLAATPEARVLVACSGEEYGPPPPEELPVREGAQLRPQSPYAVSKAMCDLLAGFYADAHGLDVLRTRAFNHAGPGQSDVYVASSFARQIAEAEVLTPDLGRVVVLTGNPEVSRDFTDVRDVVRAYRLALERAAPGAYNVCSGSSTRVTDILARLARHTPLEAERRTDPARVRSHEVMEIRGSHDRLAQATGWRPEIELDRTLADTLEWWRERLRAEAPR
jgi:GDP-4-dehydro-6-deoxy-D-mannose reductase